MSPRKQLLELLGLVGVFVVLALVVYLGIYRNYPVAVPPSPTPTPAPITGVEYRNDTFGFKIPLPQNWKGYTVNHIKEDIYDATGTTTKNNGVVDSFQIIELHHPAETAQNPYEKMPVMIFTPAQWDHVQKEEWSVSAAPIPPSILGQNSQWVIALPARYNYDFKPGWEEVDQLVHKLQTFEPK